MTSKRPGKSIEGWIRSIVGRRGSPAELEKLEHRLDTHRRAMSDLDALLEPGLEPLPTVSIEPEKDRVG